MCKPKGVPYGKMDDYIRAGCASNSQGYGFAYKRAGRLHMAKGFFNVDEMLKMIKSVDPKEHDELMVHGRIATTGSVNARNCHPFIIDSDNENIHAFADKAIHVVEEHPVMAHNGCLPNKPDVCDDDTDTATFIRKILGRDPNIIKLAFENPKVFEDIFSDMLGGFTLIAMMYPGNEYPMTFIRLHQFIIHEGLIFSNDGFRRTSAYQQQIDEFDFSNDIVPYYEVEASEIEKDFVDFETPEDVSELIEDAEVPDDSDNEIITPHNFKRIILFPKMNNNGGYSPNQPYEITSLSPGSKVVTIKKLGQEDFAPIIMRQEKMIASFNIISMREKNVKKQKANILYRAKAIQDKKK